MFKCGQTVVTKACVGLGSIPAGTEGVVVDIDPCNENALWVRFLKADLTLMWWVDAQDLDAISDKEI